MEGYSVTEAASILGVPTERVWELLARGVLSGTAEGETGMRVYLQPRPAPAPPVADTGRPSGDAGTREPERELSPFRELLTEFRNLTERYGQALLALGEARGEVAALRSRVDLLEARMDLRLPMSAPAAWPAPMPQPAARDVAPAEEAEVTADDDAAVAHDADEERPARRRRHRRATENFAEALARAEDPTRPELPGAAETAAALAALRADGAGDARGWDSSMPRELPAADAIPMADEAPLPEPSFAAPDAERTAEPEPQLEPEPVVAAEPDHEAEPEVPARDEAPPPDDVAPITWDPERYSVDIGEPDWFVEEDASPPALVDEEPQAEPEPEPEPEPESAEPVIDLAAAEVASRPEETMLWFGNEPAADPAGPADTTNADTTDTADADTGADEMEVVGSQPSPPPPPRMLPGSRELDEALAALDALAGRSRPVESATAPARATAERAWPAADRPPTLAAPDRPEPLPSRAAPDQPRLATTPASRAYRRLRRIFPG